MNGTMELVVRHEGFLEFGAASQGNQGPLEAVVGDFQQLQIPRAIKGVNVDAGEVIVVDGDSL